FGVLTSRGHQVATAPCTVPKAPQLVSQRRLSDLGRQCMLAWAASEFAKVRGAINLMSSTANTKYQVLLTPQPAAAPEAGQPQCWRATVLGFPNLIAEACSREQALDQIKTSLEEILRRSEIVTVTVPTLPAVLNGADSELAAMGWDDYGIFANDPEALKLFDEIEEERNKHLIAPVSPAALNEDDELAALGYRHYGVFADDPAALKLFDEIEEERNKHLIAPSQT
ncbi:MAG: hypothetical protein ACREEM_54020, partial [Blastocatellia bacterium]